MGASKHNGISYTQIRHKLGFTRSDGTVASFLLLAGLIGFAYVTWFDTRGNTNMAGLPALVVYHDSVDADAKSASAHDSSGTTTEETTIPVTTENIDSVVTSLGDTATRETMQPNGGEEGTPPPAWPIDINTAGYDHIMLLPGIGEVLTGRIICYRDSIGFTSPRDIMNVKGIGAKKYEAIRELITVGKEK